MADWLDLPAPGAVPAWHYKNTGGKGRKPYVPVKHDGSAAKRRAELLALRRDLPLPQREYLDALTESGFHTGNAHRRMVLKGFLYEKKALNRWRSRPRLKRAIELAEEDAMEKAGLKGARVLSRVNLLAEYGLDEIPLRDKHGEVVTDPATGEPVRMMRNPELALKANELLGKNQKLWGSDQEQTRVTVQIVNLAGDQPGETMRDGDTILDGEFTQVDE